MKRTQHHQQKSPANFVCRNLTKSFIRMFIWWEQDTGISMKGNVRSSNAILILVKLMIFYDSHRTSYIDSFYIRLITLRLSLLPLLLFCYCRRTRGNRAQINEIYGFCNLPKALTSSELSWNWKLIFIRHHTRRMYRRRPYSLEGSYCNFFIHVFHSFIHVLITFIKISRWHVPIVNFSFMPNIHVFHPHPHP
jgi:hypothetical protein